jgi:hypothetical protein
MARESKNRQRQQERQQQDEQISRREAISHL